MSKTIFGRYRSEDGTVTRCHMTVSPLHAATVVAENAARNASSHTLEQLGLDRQARERLQQQIMGIDDEAAHQLAFL